MDDTCTTLAAVTVPVHPGIRGTLNGPAEVTLWDLNSRACSTVMVTSGPSGNHSVSLAGTNVVVFLQQTRKVKNAGENDRKLE